MADINTYRRCVMNYVSGGLSYHIGDVRSSSDAAVTANPQWWITMTDTEMSDGKHGTHTT
jgi:hypothetical protein